MDKLQVAKSTNEELRLATFIVLEPNDETSGDLHGDIYSELTVRKAALSFNQSPQRPYMLHQEESDGFTFVESYIAPVEFVLGEQTVKKGTWLATVHVTDDDIWEGIKSGDINGLSIGAHAICEYLE